MTADRPTTLQLVLITSSGAALALFGCWGVVSLGEAAGALGTLGFMAGTFFFGFGLVLLMSRGFRNFLRALKNEPPAS